MMLAVLSFAPDSSMLLDALEDQAAVLDGTGCIVMVNKAWVNFARQNGGDLTRAGVGVNYIQACHTDRVTDQNGDLSQRLHQVIIGEITHLAVEYPCHSPTDQRWYMMRAGHLQPQGALITHTSITKHRMAELEHLALANHDPLTHILNRRGLTTYLQHALLRSRRTGESLCAMLIDCDNFKEINNARGHAAGDAVLIGISQLIAESVRPTDIFARLGGDEFIVLMPDTTIAGAVAAGERLCEHIANAPVAVDGFSSVTVTLSVAVSLLDDSTASVEDILRACGPALARSKSFGKNRVTSELALQSSKEALLHCSIRIASQSIIELGSERVLGYEFLARGEGEYISPALMFQQAKDMRILQQIDMRCIKAAFSLVADVPAYQFVHINVYPSTLLSLDLNYLEELLPNIVQRTQVCLELSEQEIIGDVMALRHKLQSIRQLGFTVAVDDVGFGRTCLENLLVLEPDVIKIDRRFVDFVASDMVKRKQLTRLLQVAGTLHASVVVEGVERQQDADVCRQAGAVMAQGYLWSRPTIIASSR
jgi:diguanylate cyclase (GGDEF)-like protein